MWISPVNPPPRLSLSLHGSLSDRVRETHRLRLSLSLISRRRMIARDTPPNRWKQSRAPNTDDPTRKQQVHAPTTARATTPVMPAPPISEVYRQPHTQHRARRRQGNWAARACVRHRCQPRPPPSTHLRPPRSPVWPSPSSPPPPPLTARTGAPPTQTRRWERASTCWRRCTR